MVNKRIAHVILGLSCAVLLSTALQAAKTTRKTTTVHVKNMHCEACAKKIAGSLFTVPGVVDVQTNVKKGIAIVKPQRTKNPSPKALWEAVEQAKFTPVKITSPRGVFKKKPKI